MTTARESIGQRFYDEDRGIHNPVTETKAAKSKKYETLRAEVDSICKCDSASNYADADTMAEGVLSEIEATRDVDEHEADQISGLVENWFFEHLDQDEE